MINTMENTIKELSVTKSLQLLRDVGKINLNSSKIESLGNLTKAKDLVLSHTSLKSLGNLKEVNRLHL